MAQKASSLVKSTRPAGHEKSVTLESNNGRKAKIMVPRFAPITKDDRLFVSGLTSKKMWLESAEDPNDKIEIFPVFSNEQTIRIGRKPIKLVLHEIETADDMAGYEELERFHYRTNPSLIDQPDEELRSEAGSRKAVILAHTYHGKRKEYIGYMELTMPLMMVGPRTSSFSRPFSHSQRDVAWTNWTQNSLKQHLNLIVRIGRVVTHPTYRGIGLAKVLIEAAEQYSITRWHIRRRRPLFLEISAEMLNYFDFVSSSGFVYCGHTKGNLERIGKDMHAMSRGQKIGSGIMTLQQKYFKLVEAYAERESLDVPAAIEKIEAIAKDLINNVSRPTDLESWIILKKIYRLPRPYFVKGLDKDTKRYLADLQVEKEFEIDTELKNFSTKIIVKNLEAVADIMLPASESVNIVTDAFGLEGDRIQQTLTKIDNFSASSGEVFLLAGASGTGKTIFLDILGKHDYPLPKNLSVSFDTLEIAGTAKFNSIDPNSIVIDHFADRYGIERSLRLLALVGLSEAIPLVKPFWMLSRGQKYRALLADLVCQEKPVWLLDEFASDLDPLTATIVASKLRSIAKRIGSIVFVAAANNEHFYAALRPNKVIKFDLGLEPRVMTMTEYKNELF